VLVRHAVPPHSELLGGVPTPTQFVTHLRSDARSQAGYLSDIYNNAGLIASEPSAGSRLWARARGRGAEDGALSSLEERARAQEQQLVGQQREGSAPRYQSVEEGALASIAAQAQQQLRMVKQRRELEAQRQQQRQQQRQNAASRRQAAVQTAVVSRQHTVSSRSSTKPDKYHVTTRDDGNPIKMASDGTLLEPKAKYTWRDDGAKLWFDGHVTAPKKAHPSASLGAWAMHVSRLSKGKEKVREMAKLKLAHREQQLARVARWDDELTAEQQRDKQKSEVLHLVQAASKQATAKSSRTTSAHRAKATPSSKLMWPGEDEGVVKGVVHAAAAGQHMKKVSDATPAASNIAQATSDSAEKGIAWPGEGAQNTVWPGERGYTKPAGTAKGSKGDRLAWPDGHMSDATPLQPAASSAAQAGRHGGGWNNLNTEWSWPQEGAEASSKGVESQLNLVLLIDGATQASMKMREQGIFEAVVAEAAGVSLQQLHVDYAVDVPGLLGHMEVSLRLTLAPGVSCGAVAANVRQAVQSGKLNSMLSDFGADGLAVSLLNMSGCPAAMMPAPAPLPSQDDSAPQIVGPSGSGAEEGFHPAPRGRAGLTSDEAVEAAQQVATQTAQQVASQVATAAAADTAQQLEGELRTLAEKVATATATKVTHDILARASARHGGAGGSSVTSFKARPTSGLKQLEVAAARTAAQRYGP